MIISQNSLKKLVILKAEERNDIKVGKINVDDEPELASQFQVMSIPMLAVIKNGKIANSTVGARSGQAVSYLKRNGYTDVTNIGGISAYKGKAVK